MAQKRHRQTWPKGTWMRLISGTRLRAMIDKTGLSYAEFADDIRTPEVRCSKSMVGHLCTETRRTCTPALAERIARRLGVEVDMLFVPSVSIDSGRISHQQRTAVAA